MKIVLDTNVLVSATLWEDSVCQKLLASLIKRKDAIYSSPFILKEYAGVVVRDFDYSEAEVWKILKYINSFIKIINPNCMIDVISSDQTDNKVLECAVSSASEYVCTYDKHLLCLGDYRGIIIEKPEATIKRIGTYNGEPN